MTHTYTILGASGFIGQHVVRAIRAAGGTCFTPRRDAPEVFERDLGHVIYCIGLTADFRQRPLDTVHAHTGYLARVLERARFDKLVYLSSTRLYDALPTSTCSEDTPLQLDPANPRHLYDLSKALGENLCLTAADGRASVARLSCVYAQASGAPGFLSDLLARLAHARAVHLNSSSGYVRDYVHVDDVVRALLRMLEQPAPGIYNVASGENLSNQALADLLRAHGYTLTLAHNSARQPMPVCDITKLKCALGVDPITVGAFLSRHLRTVEHGSD
ncbi:NAD-dependent epimerase/dehydratase family protein [Ralstonia soli]|uniref:NAD-dependent epimerase/dehydratase n=1 Tax=Ralstonia soli TaxID=2953896 RepID=A0ABT1APV1_9RALS|nr:NAD-dependent epimerase/dehydratase family protein [Ralstonia soli]MCO5400269.1 NAD-dependent epimerase/dehydratase [Ralstonia soli]